MLRRAKVSYIKAQDVLPEDIVKLIQKYVDGECLYIPRKDGEEKSWGEKNGTRTLFKKRDREIYLQYVNGSTISHLAETYFLSEKSIRRILSKEKSCV